jgi:hypothetical protein
MEVKMKFQARGGPELEFDGRIFWYVDRYDPDDDLCCAPDCRKPIDEDEVPLILWKDDAKKMARLHFACADRIGLLRALVRGGPR